jgi:hypothetical protein
MSHMKHKYPLFSFTVIISSISTRSASTQMWKDGWEKILFKFMGRGGEQNLNNWNDIFNVTCERHQCDSTTTTTTISIHILICCLLKMPEWCVMNHQKESLPFAIFTVTLKDLWNVYMYVCKCQFEPPYPAHVADRN